MAVVDSSAGSGYVAPMSTDEPKNSRGHIGVAIGLVGVLAIGPIMANVSGELGDNPAEAAIAKHNALAAETEAFYAIADSRELRIALMNDGAPAALAHAPDLTKAHLVLEGGSQVDGDRDGVAFRYREGDHIYVLQTYVELPGSGVTSHSRHIGHNLMRGYKGVDSSAAFWSEHGTTYVFTGEGDEEHILDVAALAFYGMTGGGGGHH